MPEKRPTVVVIGAGFGGLKAVQGLRKAPVDIVLIDRHNYHLFQPLLYQVATAALSPADIAYPIRRIFRNQKNVAVVLGEVEKIDLSNRRFGGERGMFPFDYLVLAVGATHSYFGNPEWARLAPGLKTIDDATELRRRMLMAYEEAEYEADEESRRAKLTFVVIGGGPTGVEMAGALREIAAETIQKDFRTIDTSTAQIILVQGAERLLPGFHPTLSAKAKSDLEAMGVQVRLDARVTQVDEEGVWIGEEQLRANNVIWAAGVQAMPLLKTLGVPTDRAGRVIVGPDLSVPGHPHVFVIGDAAAAKDDQSDQFLPGLAPVAMQAGKYVARIIRNELHAVRGAAGSAPPTDGTGHTAADAQAMRKPFHYVDKGTMATIGKRRAIADIHGFKFSGFIAWVLWGVVHLMFLVSFRNRLWVMLNWMYEYFTNGREARLITGDARMNIRKIRTENAPAVQSAT